MTMHRCHVPRVDGATVVLTGGEAHHVSRVLRLGAGAAVAVFDGRGHEWTGVVAAVDRDTVTVAGLTPREPVAEPGVAVTLGVGLLKGEQMTTVVRDAVMLGATVIVPIASTHTSRPVRSGETVARWERVALASARQCGRALVPAVRPVTLFEDVLEEPVDLRVICVEPSIGGGTNEPLPRPAATALVLAGPEGGWSDGELTRAEAAGARRLRLGPRTLRAETAPAVALTSLWTRWGWA